ncbi:hypothetical protein [Microbacterium sp. YY-01]|uniref:hypothetical protein n=1 Tax=Microbacterium sp. YY-01 TaxID=3421634 RepID=UPI003D17FE0D
MSDTPRLDLTTDTAKRDAAAALPALILGSALGSRAASQMGGQILGQIISDALAPSFAALGRLRATNHENRSET